MTNISKNAPMKFVLLAAGAVAALLQAVGSFWPILQFLPSLFENLFYSIGEIVDYPGSAFIGVLNFLAYFSLFLSFPIYVFAAVSALRGALRTSAIMLLVGAIVSDVLPAILGNVIKASGGGTIHFQPFVPGFWVLEADVDFLTFLSAWVSYPIVVIAIIGLVVSKTEKSLVEGPAQVSAMVSAEASQISTPTTKPKKETKMTDSKQWEVLIPGAPDAKVDTATLAMWAQAGTVKADTMIKEIATGASFPARQIPGVFSDKQYLVALLLSFFLGVIGVDRFYTGHTGLGIGKLLTAGGCGIWALIDFILYATRKVNDSNGRPLQ
jgi:hypothetical protein